jgi:hypothetical protein
MLFKEIIPVHTENQTTPINKNVHLLIVKRVESIVIPRAIKS